MCATYSFVSLDYAERLGLRLSFMAGSMIIDTQALGLVITSWVCLNYPLTISDKNFGMYLVCIPLINLDFILGMNWLEFNCVHINSLDTTMSFPEFDMSDEMFVLAKQVDEFVKDDAEVFMLLALTKAKRKFAIDELPVVCDFLEVFPDDRSDFLPEHKVEFAIDLVPNTRMVLMASYRMYDSDLSEL
ncbi:uncharacterized protein LOC127136203 [Lathyrus oleraceus]|uniref:uncharacterized protein LOC127136203 n=1 Tax=Pisum sativum TaxID=3888 RepID=UPI0021CFC20B|nr:uncharacterized protein LOC127136203 [Pisum sativum]